ncbi:Glucokinase [Paenibacillus sp. CECT 9249]|uniref:ROK family protein n=1 Tax=Paenibacillus sp. CECT 9249 TaxID=2845385 RepID=UPI001E3BD869|nr:ROK family protein [Paenibacillus sp. CECT 9249]CAH0119233.1 Glucokinase [Paenibacillus sp. CECT 9249]
MLAIGIDIGGTKIVGGIVDEQGNMIRSVERATEAEKGKAYLLENLERLTEELLAETSADAIGIGSAGRIDVHEGTVYYATPNLPDWTGVRLKQHMVDRFGIPTAVDNDVNAAGIGEMWLGAGKRYSSVVCLTLGTGVAAAVFVNREIVRGHHWSAGEIGHMILYPKGKRCNCGQWGCMEQYCSGTALFKTYNEICGKHAVSSGKQFFALLQSGDGIARQVLDAFTDDLAIAMVSLCNIYDPEVFIIGGGLIETQSYWWDAMLEKIGRYANEAVRRPVVLPARFKNQAGLLGAAKLAFDELTKQ